MIVAVLVADGVPGSPLQLNSALGFSAEVAGRFIGYGNAGYAALAAAALLLAGLARAPARRRPARAAPGRLGRRRRARGRARRRRRAVLGRRRRWRALDGARLRRRRRAAARLAAPGPDPQRRPRRRRRPWSPSPARRPPTCSGPPATGPTSAGWSSRCRAKASTRSPSVVRRKLDMNLASLSTLGLAHPRADRARVRRVPGVRRARDRSLELVRRIPTLRADARRLRGPARCSATRSTTPGSWSRDHARRAHPGAGRADRRRSAGRSGTKRGTRCDPAVSRGSRCVTRCRRRSAPSRRRGCRSSSPR